MHDSLVGHDLTTWMMAYWTKETLKKYKISNKRKESGQGRYPDAMGDVLAHKLFTQPDHEAVVDALADSQVQNTQTEDIDDDLTGTGSTLNTSDTTGNAVPSPTSNVATKWQLLLKGRRRMIIELKKWRRYPTENARQKEM